MPDSEEAKIPTTRLAFFMRELLLMLKEFPEGISPAKKAMDMLAERVILTEWEAGKTKSGRRRFDVALAFSSTVLRDAGWLIKDNFIRWLISEEGIKALNDYLDPVEFRRTANRLAREWKKQQASLTDTAALPTADGASHEDEEEDTESAIEAEDESPYSFFLDAKAQARQIIEDYITTMPATEFQYLTQDLLRAMGYYVQWGAIAGPDGGVDILAFNDPLGVTEPRIKVQVKCWKNQTSEPDLRSFAGALVDDKDVGLFISTGGFTGPALKYARGYSKQLTAIDLDQFLALWIEHSHKLPDKAKIRLPLEPVYMLAKGKE
jgi:restriction system protein